MSVTSTLTAKITLYGHEEKKLSDKAHRQILGWHSIMSLKYLFQFCVKFHHFSYIYINRQRPIIANRPGVLCLGNI